MPNVGKPSEACHLCRSRRVKVSRQPQPHQPGGEANAQALTSCSSVISPARRARDVSSTAKPARATATVQS